MSVIITALSTVFDDLTSGFFSLISLNLGIHLGMPKNAICVCDFWKSEHVAKRQKLMFPIKAPHWIE